MLCDSSTTFQKLLVSRYPQGRNEEDPIVLAGHSAQEFYELLCALASVENLPDPSDVPLHRLLSVADLALTYRCTALQHWSKLGLRSWVSSKPTRSPLRHTSIMDLTRTLKVALRYNHTPLVDSIQNLWACRMLLHELPSVYAIRLVSNWQNSAHCNLQFLLGHAYYMHMLDLELHLSNCAHIDDDVGVPLTFSENMHVLCGYYSLQCWWKQIGKRPPAYMHCKNCAFPEKCSAAWNSKWGTLAEQDSPFPTVDPIRRLLHMQGRLACDPALALCMSGGCRRRAFEALIKRRLQVWNNLHHHFDL